MSRKNGSVKCLLNNEDEEEEGDKEEGDKEEEVVVKE